MDDRKGSLIEAGPGRRGSRGPLLAERVDSREGKSHHDHLNKSDEESSFEVVAEFDKDHIGQFREEDLNSLKIEDLPLLKNFHLHEFTADQEPYSFTFYFPEHEIHTLRGIDQLKDPALIQKVSSKPFWLDVSGFSPHSLSALAKIFGIHPLTVEDIWNEESREKCELFDEYTFVCMRALRGFNEDTRTYLNTETVYIIFCEKYVMSLHANQIDNIRSIQERLYRLQKLRLSASWFFYAILDDIVDAYVPIVEMMEIECESIEDLVSLLTETEKNDMVRRIGKARKETTTLYKLISTKDEIFKMLHTREQKFHRALIEKEVLLYVGDVVSHVVSMEQNLLQLHDVLDRAHSNYLARVSIELTQASNHLGMLMKKFSAGASVFLPLTLLSGIMGMNVRVPGQLQGEADSVIWFWGIIGLMLSIALTMFLIGKRRGWF